LGTSRQKAITGTPGDPNAGWLYDAANGKINANTLADEVDDRGVLYSNY
jgi:hypothetical protein